MGMRVCSAGDQQLPRDPPYKRQKLHPGPRGVVGKGWEADRTIPGRLQAAGRDEAPGREGGREMGPGQLFLSQRQTPAGNFLETIVIFRTVPSRPSRNPPDEEEQPHPHNDSTAAGEISAFIFLCQSKSKAF